MSDFQQYSKEAMRIEYEKGYRQGRIEAYQEICGFMFGMCISDNEALRAAERIKQVSESA